MKRVNYAHFDSSTKIFNENICFLISEGKGLGCVATVDIEKGSLILAENPQICAEYGLGSQIKSLLKSFKRMKKADQLEYMALHNKFNNTPPNIVPWINGEINQEI